MTDAACLVPVYDGRKDYSPSKYWARLYDQAFEIGTMVTLLFSIKKGTLPENARHFRHSQEMVGVYVNILAIVVLANPMDAFCLDTSPDPEMVHGVESLPRLATAEVEGDVDEEDVGNDNLHRVEVF